MSLAHVLLHPIYNMDASIFLCKPFQPSFDTIINAGRRYYNYPGNVFFRRFIRLYFTHYMKAKDKSLFREWLVAEYRLQYQRAFYWYDERGQQFIPLLSDIVIGKKTRKLFENVYRTCRVSAMSGSISGTVSDQEETDFNRHDNQSKYMADSYVSVETAPHYDDKESDMADAHLLVETARKMHHLMLEQFSTPDRIRNYAAMLNEGAGDGKYSRQENSQFGPLLELCPSVSVSNDDYSNDDDYESKVGDEEYVRHGNVTSTRKKSMEEKIAEIESKPHIKQYDIDQFRIRPVSRMHWNKPRMSVGALLLLCPKHNYQVTVRLVQILRDRACLDSFLYVLKSPSDVSNPHYQIISEGGLFDMIEKSRACAVRTASEETSKSALTSDIYSYSSNLHVSGLRYFRSSLARRHSLDVFLSKISRPKFINDHRLFMDGLKSLVLSFISSANNNNTRRIGWAKWLCLEKHERWYSWQITTLLLLTNSVKDTIVKDIVEVLFSRFPNPLIVCENPAKFFDFLTSKAKDFSPMDRDFNSSTDVIGKGPNYCYQKATYIVAMSKVVVLVWCEQNVPTCSSGGWKTLCEKYCDTANRTSLCRPLPKPWLIKCQDADSSTLFPKVYSEAFFSRLPGIGLKMRHLCAEAIYGTVVGPAIDCHCIRFCVEMGTIHASMNLRQMSSSLIAIYRNDQLVDLNEIPATISQIMSTSSSSKGVMPCGTASFAASLCDIALHHNLIENMKSFLRHYNRPQGEVVLHRN